LVETIDRLQRLVSCQRVTLITGRSETLEVTKWSSSYFGW